MTKLQHWWAGCTPTGKCLIAVGAMLAVILLVVVV